MLKSADLWLKFVLITGVTKFAQVGIFSNLNQLSDISFDPRYATLCGMTRGEIETAFTPELQSLASSNNLTYNEALTELTRMYDGYYFLENQPEGMYNPFSVLSALASGKFRSFWFATGTPTFLAEMLKKTHCDLRKLDGVEVTAASLSDDRADVNNPIPMIYQSGYLTVKGYNERFRMYTLGFPNEEVKYGFLNFAAPFYTPMSSELTRLRAFFADFPYEFNDKTEQHYQVVFYLVFKLMGQFINAEVRSAQGRADAVVKTNDYIYVFEFKLNGTVKEALKQIDEKGYLIPYRADTQKLIKIGVTFNAEKRNLGDWEIVEESRK